MNGKIQGGMWIYTDKQKAAAHVRKASTPVAKLERQINDMEKQVGGQGEMIEIKWKRGEHVNNFSILSGF